MFNNFILICYQCEDINNFDYLNPDKDLESMSGSEPELDLDSYSESELEITL